jgi:hypothetical protein
LYIPFYIDLNIFDLIKKSNFTENKKLEFLKNYKWSSFRDYFNKNTSEFSRIINKDLFYENFDITSKDYLKEIGGFLKEREYDKLVDLAG